MNRSLSILLGCLCAAACSVAAPTTAAATADRVLTTSAGPGLRHLQVPSGASMVGASWSGNGQVWLRAERGDGWTGWVAVERDSQDGPDPGSAEGRTARLWSAPVWIGSVARVALRTSGRVGSLRLHWVHSSSRPADRRIASLRSTAAEQTPAIITRQAWGADESLRRASPSYFAAVRAAVVHHTVSANTYSQAQAPAVVRSIYRYHVSSNGWNDIGYNLLIDRYGGVYEGRAGGLTSPVLGAHTAGFNSGTVGIALIGSYDSQVPPPAQMAALERVLSWRLDQAHVEPTATSALRSAGNGKYRSGAVVHARNVSGHRDLYATACPGAQVYGALDAHAAAAWTAHGAKIVDPVVTAETAEEGTIVRLDIGARANVEVQWRLRLFSLDGGILHDSSASGSTFQLNIEGAGRLRSMRPADVRMLLEGSAGADVATPVDRPLVAVPAEPIDVTIVASSSGTFTPNGDGLREQLPLRVRSNVPGTASVSVIRQDGTVAATTATRSLAAGETLLPLSGVIGSVALPDGAYTARLNARDGGGRSDSATIAFGIDRAIRFSRMAARFSPTGDGRQDTLPVKVSGPPASHVEIAVVGARGSRQVLADGPVASLPPVLAWDGAIAGVAAPQGRYRVQVTHRTAPFAPSIVFRLVTVDRLAPKVRVLRRRGRIAGLTVGEPAFAAARINGRLRRARLRPGLNRPRRLLQARLVVVTDFAGNRTVLRLRK